MTDSTIGIRGVLPFAGTPERRRQFQSRGEHSLTKHAGAVEDDAALAANEPRPEPLSLDPGRVLDISV